MNKNLLLIIGAVLLLIGSVLRLMNLETSVHHWLKIAGMSVVLVYFVLSLKKKRVKEI